MFSTKQEQVNYVLDCFRHMEATPKQIAKELVKLHYDEEYLYSWLKTTEYKPGKKSWVWNLLRRYIL